MRRGCKAAGHTAQEGQWAQGVDVFSGLCLSRSEMPRPPSPPFGSGAFKEATAYPEDAPESNTFRARTCPSNQALPAQAPLELGLADLSTVASLSAAATFKETLGEGGDLMRSAADTSAFGLAAVWEHPLRGLRGSFASSFTAAGDAQSIPPV